MNNEIVRAFMTSTKIQETPNHTVEAIMDFLTEPASVNKMIVATNMGLPALTGIVRELEEKFAASDFPLNHSGPHSNSTNRRNIGWMIKYVMREYGYIPLAQDAQSRIGSFAGAKYFITAAKYEKIASNPKHQIIVSDCVREVDNV